MFKRFLRDTGGQFAIMFALGASALIVAVGVAVDYTGLSALTSEAQDMADAAVLTAAKSLETDQGKLKQIATKAANENNETGMRIRTSLMVKEDVIRVEVHTNYKTHILGIIGKRTIPTSVYAESPFATSNPLNIALVLDATGSMDGQNMSDLQRAANGLVNTFERLDNDKIRVGIVPFSQYATLPTSYRNQPWLDVAPDFVETHDQVCRTHTPVISSSGCTTSTSESCSLGHTSYDDGVATNHPGSCSTQTTETCTHYEYGPEETTCETPDPTYWVWKGVVGSRSGNKHKVADFGGTPIPGILEKQSSGSIGTSALLPLTDSYSSMRSKINSLAANGETYIPAGLIWGWRMLTPNAPLTEINSNSGPFMQNALVLMTDGMNTKSLAHPPRHDGNDGLEADKLSGELCDSIKAENIAIYTVAYRFPGAAGNTRKMLEDCASQDENFFFAQTASELEDAFERIALSLFETRISS